MGSNDRNSSQAVSRLLAQGNGYHAVVDETASAYVAANVAGNLSMSLSTQVSQDAEDLSQQRQFVAASDNYLSKSSTIATDSKTNDDIRLYTVKSGESLSDIAKKFGVTTDTIRWANELGANEDVSAGVKLTILPVNGVLHTVGDDDNAKSLAAHYEANAAQIISFNDAEVSGLKKGQKIIIPDGIKSAPEPAPVTIPAQGHSYLAGSFTPRYTGNGYAYGYCTWYVASRIKVPNNWGNAATWADYARLSGWNVSSSPTVGSIAQNSYMAGGLGHVAIVEQVSPDGRRIKIADMNGVCGWGCEGVSGWTSASAYPSFISR